MLIDDFIEKEQFHHDFQPIFNIENGLRIGYEILLRTTIYPNPEFAFNEAKKANRLFDLDSQSIAKALSTYGSGGVSRKDELLFINVYPSTISDCTFIRLLHQLTRQNELSKENIVLEIAESELIEHPNCFMHELQALKQQGYRIALDDVGKGYANFDMLIELEPDYIKLDKMFANDLDTSTKKQGLIRFFLFYCKENQVTLILEGLETKAELLMAKDLGIPIGQGFFLGRPAALNQASKYTIG
ncbi:hypothetical protein GCM10011351_17810 [Paraliobacillus quinghaiensis]|uniref:EAL domain-containing protein n=1 Tax=Paraliobacillus quinghaiensis TaxID=470815 RepID=A0A917WUU9_9BACI|nr:EAL domain-containing protein [Paraliobacillus quinghaiensis]GGM32084.1 hypothetical protein GCM10011351_17810 [Paraliobacillus quinghaiensis]